MFPARADADRPRAHRRPAIDLHHRPANPTLRPALRILLFGAAAVPVAVAPGTPVASVSYLVAMVALALMVSFGATRLHGAAASGWQLIAAATWCWLLGDVVQRVHGLADGFGSGVPLPDLMWLASYPLLAGGLVAMLRGRGLDGAIRRDVRSDALVVVLATGLLAWNIAVAPQLEGGTFGSAAVLALLYPLGDVVLLLAVLNVLMAPGLPSAAGRMLVGCVGATLVVDTAFFALPILAPSFDVDRLDAALLVCNGLLAAAVAHPSAAVPAQPAPIDGPRRLHRWRILLLGGALVTVNVASLSPLHAPSATDRTIAVGTAVATTALVVLRLYRVVRGRELAEDALRYQATHDQLTGLANRSMLLDELGRALARTAAPGRDPGPLLLYLDLDGFKKINDEHGHAAGDAVLEEVGRRLAAVTRRGDVVARLGGDEFVVLCYGVPPDGAQALGTKLCESVRRPIEVHGLEVSVGASVGIVAVTVPTDAAGLGIAGAEAALGTADAAMYRAKRSGGGYRLVEH